MTTKKTNKESTGAAQEQVGARASARWKADKSNTVAEENKKVPKNAAKHPQSVKSGEKQLNDRQKRFVDEYIIDLNATQAAIRAGYSEKTAGQQAFDLLRKLEIQNLIAERQRDLQRRTEITQEMVLMRWWEIATADPNELISHRRVCCRNCFGKDHGYQWIDEAEWLAAVRFAKLGAGDKFKAEDAPSNEGGYGFDATIRPHPKCPICKGEGHGQVFATDTRDVSGPARALYAGVKQTKDGMEIKMRDQDAALANVARHLGMFNDKLKLQGDPECPLVALLQKVAGSALPIASGQPDDSDDE
jgi:phage terminase small subunit